MNLETLCLKTVRLDLVQESDAEFILSLRLDPNLNQFLSKVGSDIQSQIEWLLKYKVDEKKGLQYYFIISRLDGVKCGTVRVYDIKDNSFSWGSWILNSEKTRYAAIESALLVYQFGFDFLGLENSHFEVMKGNSNVVNFHKRMGAVEVGEDDNFYYFTINKKDVLSARDGILASVI